MMEKVTLYYEKRPDIKISIELYFNEKDQLFFDGNDIGKRVKDYWGDSDYEYTYTIEPEQVEKLYKIFKLDSGDRMGLLKAIKDRFGGNKAYSSFGDFMSEHNIKYTGFTWT